MSSRDDASKTKGKRSFRHPWQAQVLTRAEELQFVLDVVVVKEGLTAAEEVGIAELRDQLERAKAIARSRVRRWGLWSVRELRQASAVERAYGLLDSVEISILRLADSRYVIGQLPSLLAQVRSHLPIGDERLRRLESIALRYPIPRGPDDPCDRELCDDERNAVIAAMRASALEARRELARVRNLANMFRAVAVVLVLGVIGLGAVGFLYKEAIPLCFTPDDKAVVCPLSGSSEILTAPPPGGSVAAERDEGLVTFYTRRTSSRGDILIVELLGFLAAVIAGARGLRQLEGTSTPFDLPLASAILKLPTGAITAVIGLVLMRGGFVPGLSALDNSAQILAWAVIFGFSQELFTRFADTQAQAVLGKVGTPGDQKLPDGTTVPSHATSA